MVDIIAVIIVMTNMVNVVGFTPMNMTAKYKNPIRRIKTKPDSDIHFCIKYMLRVSVGDSTPCAGVDGGEPCAGVDGGEPCAGVDGGEPCAGVDGGEPCAAVDGGETCAATGDSRPCAAVDGGGSCAAEADTSLALCLSC